MKYEIRYTPEANIGLAKLEKYEPKASFIQIEISGLCI